MADTDFTSFSQDSATQGWYGASANANLRTANVVDNAEAGGGWVCNVNPTEFIIECNTRTGTTITTSKIDFAGMVAFGVSGSTVYFTDGTTNFSAARAGTPGVEPVVVVAAFSKYTKPGDYKTVALTSTAYYAWFIGGYLSPTDLTNLKTRIDTYTTAMGIS